MDRQIPKFNLLTSALLLSLTALPAQAQWHETTPSGLLVEQNVKAERKTSPTDLQQRLAKFRKDHPLLFKSKVLTPRADGDFWRPDVHPINGLTTPKTQQDGVLKASAVPLGRELWANVLSSASWKEGEAYYGMYAFGATPSIEINELYTSPYMFANAGGALAGNRLDIITYVSSYGSLVHYQFDAQTGEYVTGAYLNDFSLWAAETAVAADGKVYGEFYSADGTALELGIVNYATESRTTIGQLSHYYVALGITQEGVLYGVATDGNLYRIDAETAKETRIGATGLTLTTDAGDWNVQSGEIDQATGIFYWACTDYANQSALYTVDLSSGRATKVGDMSGYEQMALLSIPKETVNEAAPALATGLDVRFTQGALTGTVSFTAPTTTYTGASLSAQQLTYTVRIDGTSVKTGSVAAGGKVSEQLTTTAGNHLFAVTLANAAGEGPQAYTHRFVGEDIPASPSNVKASLDANTGKVKLSWNAVTSGVNGGYVSDISYCVTRYPGQLVIAQSTKATSLDDQLTGSELTGYYYTVVAKTASGKESEPAKSNGVTYGNVPEPPFTESFDQASDLSVFTIIDGNGDGNTWQYCPDDGSGQPSVMMEYGNYDHDDWLITPPLKLKAGQIYNISYRVKSKGGSYPEILEVKYGNEATAEGMTNVLVEQQEIVNRDYETVKKEIIPTQDGVYYFGFHCTSQADWCYQLNIDDISITGNSQKAPDAVTQISAKAASDGTNKATVYFTTPTQAIDGSQLTGTLQMGILRNGTEIQEMDNLAPGQEYYYVDSEAENGFNTYSVVAKNAEGSGRESKTVQVFVGMDTPMEPQNIQASQDEHSITLTWDPVTTGSNGGYVDPTDIVYNVYNIIETGTGVNLPLIDQVEATTITIPYETNVGEQQMINYALSSQNEMGEGPRVMSPSILVGKPYDLPFEEHFKNGGLDNSMWWVSHTGGSTIQLMQGMSAEGDGGCAGYISMDDNDSATMGSGKISVLGAKHPTLVLSTLSTVANGRGKVIVKISAPGKETKELCAIDYANIDNTAKDWHTTSMQLDPSYTSLPYVSFTFEVQAPNGETVYFDNIYLRDMVDKDLRAALSVPAKAHKGETVTAKVNVSNMGSTEMSDYTVNLYAGDQLVDTKTVADVLAPYAQKTIDLACATTVMDASPLKLKAEVVIDGDATPDDNVATADVELLPSTKTAPTQVTAKVENDERVVVEWQKVTETSELVTDDFEQYAPWSPDNFGEWISVYGEKGVARGPFSRSYPHPNEGQRFAFTVVEPASWITNTVLNDYPCLAPHSGERYIASFYSVENSQFIVADNWLISPSLPGQKQTITFWANNFKTEALHYPEDFEVLYSLSGTTLDDFQSTGVKLIAEGGEWKQYSVELPEGTTYFAIHNNTADTYMFMLDDITYTAGCGKVVAYNIYRGKQLIKRVEADAPATFTDTELPAGTHVYAVSAVYAGGESEATQAAPVTDIAAVALDGTTPFDLYTTDGKLIAKGIRSLKDFPKGVYVVDGKTIVKQ